MQTVQLQFSLRHPSMVDWRQDADYDDEVQQRLLVAHERVMGSTPAGDERPAVETELIHLQGLQMSQRQLMLLYYILAQCARSKDLSRPMNFGNALEWCSRAEHIAVSLVDLGAQVDLHEFRGTLHRAVSMFWIAAEDFSYALRLLREHAEDDSSFDPEFEVTLAAKTATIDIILAKYQRALEHIRRAQALLPLTTDSTIGPGTIEWALALIDRQRNELRSAFRHAEIAAAHYVRAGATNSTCRILSLTADIALDVAEFAGPGQESICAAYLKRAADYVKQAQKVGRVAHDKPGRELATLSQARLDRLQGSANRETIEARIRTVIRRAGAMRDESLLVAAQTALGIELIAFGEPEEGKPWLIQADALAQEIHTPGLAFRANRALRHMKGRNV